MFPLYHKATIAILSHDNNLNTFVVSTLHEFENALAALHYYTSCGKGQESKDRQLYICIVQYISIDTVNHHQGSRVKRGVKALGA